MTSLPTLYAFGSNGSGQLGIGHDEDVSVPTRCIFEDSASPCSSEKSDKQEEGVRLRASRIAAGGNHTLVLLGDGRVYAAGWGSSTFKRVTFKITESGEEVGLFRDVAATWEGSILVASETPSPGSEEEEESKKKANRTTKVFVLGTGLKGELGLGPDITNTGHSGSGNGAKILNFPSDDAHVVSVSAGMSHVVAVCSDGSLYGWGASRKGQLGESLMGEKIAWKPKRIEGVPFRVTSAVCGREFTVLCGEREKGEFVVLGPMDAKSKNGNGDGISMDKWGIRAGISDSEDVKGYIDIHASWHGVYVHQSNLSVHAWGRNDRGQIPPANEIRNVKEIAIGSEHGLALLETGSVVAFGWGEHGNCGDETDEKGDVKGKVSLIRRPDDNPSKVVGIGAGCATSWIIAEP